MKLIKFSLILILMIAAFQTVFAKDPAKVKASVPSPASNSGSKGRVNTIITVKRNDELNFDDELVEGMNRNPFDSLTHLEKKDERDQGHLYHKKANFKREVSQTAQEMGYVQ